MVFFFFRNFVAAFFSFHSAVQQRKKMKKNKGKAQRKKIWGRGKPFFGWCNAVQFHSEGLHCSGINRERQMRKQRLRDNIFTTLLIVAVPEEDRSG